MRAMERRSRDEFAPKTLNKSQLGEVKNDAKLLELAGKRDGYKQQIYALGYDKLIDAKGKTELYDKFNKSKAGYNAKKAVLRDKYLRIVRDKYFETVDTKEINNQLNGIMPQKTYVPPAVEYELLDRAAAAQLLFRPVDCLEASEVFQLRIDLMKCYTKLCFQQESPRPYKANGVAANLQQKITKPQSGPVLIQTIDEARPVDEPVEGLICGFCRWDEKAIGPKKRYYIYPRIDNLEKHVGRWHFRNRGDDELILCPYPSCAAILGSPKHFMNHAERMHRLRPQKARMATVGT
jgi:hypothetical protein